MKTIDLYYYNRNWEGNVSIYQYMDLDYLFSLLENKVYHVNKKSHFEDIRESELAFKDLFGYNLTGENLNEKEIHRKLEELSAKIKQYKESVFWPTSCWTRNQQESLLMWKFYTTKCGVRVKSCIHNVVASLDTDYYKVVCGHIEYNGYNAKTFEECLFSKDLVYKEEQEFRFYFLPRDDKKVVAKSSIGINIPIDPAILIDEIVLSPYMNHTAVEKISQLIEREYGIDSIHPSRIKIKQ